MNYFEKEEIKKDLGTVQSKVINALYPIANVITAELLTETYISNKMKTITQSIEEACVSARNTAEKYRRLYPHEEKLELPNTTVSDIAGTIELTAEGWIHIKLNSLLPHCKYKNDAYLSHTLSRLLHGFEEPLPKYEKAFLAIVEYCEFDGRRVFDQDNKAWKMIPNAIKGLIVEDDDQFHLDVGLFTKRSPELACHIYILSEKQICDFMKQLSKSL